MTGPPISEQVWSHQVQHIFGSSISVLYRRARSEHQQNICVIHKLFSLFSTHPQLLGKGFDDPGHGSDELVCIEVDKGLAAVMVMAPVITDDVIHLYLLSKITIHVDYGLATCVLS